MGSGQAPGSIRLTLKPPSSQLSWEPSSKVIAYTLAEPSSVNVTTVSKSQTAIGLVFSITNTSVAQVSVFPHASEPINRTQERPTGKFIILY